MDIQVAGLFPQLFSTIPSGKKGEKTAQTSPPQVALPKSFHWCSMAVNGKANLSKVKKKVEQNNSTKKLYRIYRSWVLGVDVVFWNHKVYIVDGFNTFETYARQIGLFHQVGVNIKKYLDPPF